MLFRSKVVFIVEEGKVTGVIDKREGRKSAKPATDKAAAVGVLDQLAEPVTNAQENDIEVSESQLNNLISVQVAESGQVGNQEIQVKQIETKKLKIKVEDSAIKPVQSVSTIESSREVKRVGAESVIPETKCILGQSEGMTKYICEIQKLPVKWFQFMFGPFFYQDNLSRAARFASIENLLWLALFGLLIFAWLRYRFKIGIYEIFPAFFLLSFSSAAALSEGNYGTAFRHRSILLGLLVLIIFGILTSNIHSNHSSARLRKYLIKSK